MGRKTLLNFCAILTPAGKNIATASDLARYLYHEADKKMYTKAGIA